MPKRPDHITNTVSGPCRTCRVYVKDAIHVDLESVDLDKPLDYDNMPYYCAGCCPLCNPREAS